jgi:hypothetical protein
MTLLRTEVFIQGGRRIGKRMSVPLPPPNSIPLPKILLPEADLSISKGCEESLLQSLQLPDRMPGYENRDGEDPSQENRKIPQQTCGVFACHLFPS